MKRQILISISYVVEAAKDEFWDKDTGYLTKEVRSGLERHFPETLELTEDLKATRENLSYMPIDTEQLEVSKCPLCDHFISGRPKPNPMMILRNAKDVDGVKLCSSCAWEIEYDVTYSHHLTKV